MSKTKVIELRQKRAKQIADARALLEAAGDRALTQEEQNNWDAMMSQADALKVTIDREERMLVQETEMSEPVYASLRPDPAGTGERGGGGARIEFRSRGMAATNEADPGWRDTPEWRRVLSTATPAYNAGFRRYMRDGMVAPELRALQADLDTAGGYFMPVQILDQLIKSVDDAVFMRQLATVYTVPNSDSIGIPTLENDPSDPAWTTELATGDLDDTMSFGKRAMQTHPIAKRIKISRKLLMKVPNIDNLVIERLGYKFGIAMENAYLTGSGSGRPLGVFTASNDGVPTSRDYATNATTTATTADHLLGAKYQLKGQYWPRARWLFHRDVVAQIAKLKTGDGQYIWQPGLANSSPDRLLGFAIVMSEYAPNTLTTGQYCGMLGDFSQYYILDSMSMEMQRLTELYAEQNTVGLIGRMDTDGSPVSPGGEAFVRLQLA